MTTSAQSDHPQIAIVCAAFDADGDRAIAEVRALVRSLGGRAAIKPAHRPHLTLSAAAVDDPSAIVRIAARIAKRHEPFRVRLSEVGAFGRGDVVWIGPSRSGPLTALQRDVYSSLVDAGHPPAFAGQSHPRGWRPHCTIARWTPPEVLAELHARFEPIYLTVNAIATIVVGGHSDVGYAAMPVRKGARR
jgi:2'-5' RNA ligase